MSETEKTVVTTATEQKEPEVKVKRNLLQWLGDKWAELKPAGKIAVGGGIAAGAAAIGLAVLNHIKPDDEDDEDDEDEDYEDDD